MYCYSKTVGYGVSLLAEILDADVIETGASDLGAGVFGSLNEISLLPRITDYIADKIFMKRDKPYIIV